jgi:hypothetical protein
MNLYWLTCIQKFDVTLQVINKTWLKHIIRFELEFEFKSRYTVDYIVEAL